MKKRRSNTWHGKIFHTKQKSGRKKTNPALVYDRETSIQTYRSKICVRDKVLVYNILLVPDKYRSTSPLKIMGRRLKMLIFCLVAAIFITNYVDGANEASTGQVCFNKRYHWYCRRFSANISAGNWCQTFAIF